MKTSRKLTLTVFLYLIVLFINISIFRGESAPIYSWIITLFLLGLITVPISSNIFNGFFDHGYIFSKTISITICSMLFFWLSSLKLIRFTSINCIITVIVVALLVYGLLLIRGKHHINIGISGLYNVLKYELAFATILTFLLWIKGYNPSAYGTERFMDYGFMQSMMLTEYFPVEDFWFSGTSLNYYYLGQYIAVFLTKLSFTKVCYSYNLMLMSLCTIAMIQAYSIIRFLLLERLDSKRAKLGSIFGGILGSLSLCVMGNMHYVIYRFIMPLSNRYLNTDFDEELIGENFWFPRSTRYIGYYPETNDKTIHEFPSYSFVLGDLHAHVINIVFVLTLIAILIAYAHKMKDKKQRLDYDNFLLLRIINPTVLLIGLFLGLFQGSNYWDYPIYLLISITVLFFVNLRVYYFCKIPLVITLLQGVIIAGISKIVILPFSMNFEKMASILRLADNHSPVYKLIILWGFHFTACIIGLVLIVIDYRKEKKEYYGRHVIRAFDAFMHQISISDFIIFILSLCAMGLILTPEFVYIKDIYEAGYARSNTMFKLTYQGYIIFSLCVPYFITKMIFSTEGRIRKIIGIIFLILTLLQCGYFATSVKLYMGNVFDFDNFKGINAQYYLYHDDAFMDDVGAIEYINDNIKEKSTILEANGLSYTNYNRISVNTGMPTLLGWHTHEWLWKDNLDLVDTRSEDIKTIYTTQDDSLRQLLIDTYDIEYIYIGSCEFEMYNTEYSTLMLDKLLELGDIVYSNQNSYLIKL
ncbi:MAG: hypothetical protein HUJ71_07005 [Pseudobutyrivibrio sp.]|nr:hypothetical protein [Pseudobutyrivibrio sp.]